MTTSPIKELKKLLTAPAPGFVCEVTPHGFEKPTVTIDLVESAWVTAITLGPKDVLELIAQVEKRRHI